MKYRSIFSVPDVSRLTSVFNISWQAQLNNSASLAFKTFCKLGIILCVFLFSINLHAQSTISFDDQGLIGCHRINDNHPFVAIGKTFNIYAGNFDGSASAPGALWYESATGGCWHSFPTVFQNGGYVTAGYFSDDAEQWYAPEALVVKTIDGSNFKFTSFKAHDAEWSSWGNYLKVIGYLDGVEIGSQSVVIVSDVQPFYSTVVLSNPIFQRVDEVRIVMDKDNNPQFGNPGLQRSDAPGLFHSFDTFVIDQAVENNDTITPVLTLPADASRDTDEDDCVYIIQGNEFDPTTATDNSGSLSSLTYSLKRLLPSPVLVSENFNSGSWNPSNFEIGSPSGGVINGEYRSTEVGGDDRGTLRTVANFIPTHQKPLYVSATLRFRGTALAFIGTRASGLKNPSYWNEPLNALYFRIHNFNNGQTNLTSTSFEGTPGDAFFANPVRVQFVDNGSNITGTFTNMVTGAVLSFNQNTTYNSGNWKVVFSGGSGVSWDDIKISLGPHEYVQEYANGSNSLAGVGLIAGEHTVKWTAEDSSGNRTTDSLMVTVADTQAPFLSGLVDLSGQSAVTNNWSTTVPDVIFGDNCSEVTLSWQMTGVHNTSGQGQVGSFTFSPGITTLTYTVRDAAGNTTSASMTVENTKTFFAGGTGTALDPYQIANWGHFFNIRSFVNKHYILLNDLDSTTGDYATYAASTSNYGAGWLPGDLIGEITIDGKGFTISDLHINRADIWENGLFNYLYNATIKNLIVKDFQIKGKGYSGFFAGSVDNVVFDNVHVINGNVNSSDFYGGLLAGVGNNVTISNSSVQGVVTGDYYMGGFLGELYSGKIENSYVNIEIDGLHTLGGLVGNYVNYNTDPMIINSFATGSISGESYLGGLIGQSSQAMILNAYSQVDLTASGNYIGGLIGNGGVIRFTNVYSTGKVVGVGQNVGVLVGNVTSPVFSGVFWDKEITGWEESALGGTGKTTTEMKDKSTFTAVDWDFTNVWGIKVASVDAGNISYPYLRAIDYDAIGANPSVNPIPGLEYVVLSQTITFEEIDEKTYGDATFTLGNALTDRGLTVTYTAADPTVVSISGNQATILKVGSTLITATQPGDESHLAAEVVVRTLTVLPATITGITFEDDTFVYDGTAKSLAISGTLPEGTTVEYADNSLTNVGSQTVTATLSGDNYETLVLTADLTISPAVITGITFEDDTFVYDGSAKSLAITGSLPGGATVAYTNNSRTNVGSQTVTATLSGDNYETLVLTADLTISPAVITGITFEDDTFVYDGSAKSLAISGTLPEGTIVAYTNNSRTNVGSQAVTATISGSNYTELELTADLTISPAVITGITFEDDTFVYDGTAKSLAISGTLPEGTTVEYADNSLTNVGSQTVTATLSGANYTTLQLTAEMEITPAVITRITFEDDTFVYDGSAKSLAITGTLPGGVTVAYTNNSRTNVGSQTVTVTLSGANYTTLQLTAEMEISPAVITGITFEDDTFVYDGSSKSLAITGTPPTGTTVTYTNNNRTNAGSQTVTVTITGANYNTLVLNADLTIRKADITGITFANGSFVYDGSEKSLTYGGTLPAGVTASYGNRTRTEAGTQTVTLTLDGGTNYNNATLTATLTINPSIRTITFPTIANKTYGDGDFSGGATASTGEQISYSSSNIHVATIIDGRIRIVGAGIATITATVPENANYTSRPEQSQQLTVNKARQQITFSLPTELRRDAGILTLNGTSSSGLPVSYQVNDPMVATVKGSNLHIQGLGTVRVTATQAGNQNYEAASAVEQSIRIVHDNSSLPGQGEPKNGDQLNIRIHQAISPNGDGQNDGFIIEGINDYEANKVTIFDTNGQIRWEAEGYNNRTISFTGKDKSGRILPQGTYFVIINIRDSGVWKSRKTFVVVRY